SLASPSGCRKCPLTQAGEKADELRIADRSPPAPSTTGRSSKPYPTPWLSPQHRSGRVGPLRSCVLWIVPRVRRKRHRWATRSAAESAQTLRASADAGAVVG